MIAIPTINPGIAAIRLMLVINIIGGISLCSPISDANCHPNRFLNPLYSFNKAYSRYRIPVSQAIPKTVNDIIEIFMDHTNQVGSLKGSGYNIYQPAPNFPMSVPKVNPAKPIIIVKKMK